MWKLIHNARYVALFPWDRSIKILKIKVTVELSLMLVNWQVREAYIDGEWRYCVSSVTLYLMSESK
jgi:hypothetical protein